MSLRKLFKKNDKNDNGIEKKGIKRILDKEGFYIIMFLCVCIVGTMAVWVAKSNVDRLAEEDIQENQEMNIVQPEMQDVAQDDMENQISDIIIIDEDYDKLDIPSDLSVLNGEDGKSKVAEENIIDEKSDSNESLQNKREKC